MGPATTPFRDPGPGWTAARDERRAAWSAAYAATATARALVVERLGRAAVGATLIAVVALGGAAATAVVAWHPVEPVGFVIAVLLAPLVVQLAAGLGRVAGAAWLARRLGPRRGLDIAEEAAFYTRDPGAELVAVAARGEALTLWLEIVAGAGWLVRASLFAGAISAAIWCVSEPVALVPVVVTMLVGGFTLVGAWITPLCLLHAVVVVRHRGRPPGVALVAAWIALVVAAIGFPLVFLGEHPEATFFMLLSALVQLGIYAAVVARATTRLVNERAVLVAQRWRA